MTVEQVVIDILRRKCNVIGDIAAESRLAEDLGLDSVGLLTLALELENHYRLHLDEDPEQPPRTVGEMLALVQSRLADA